MSSVLSILLVLFCLLSPNRASAQELVFFVDSSSSTNNQLSLFEIPFKMESQLGDKASYLKSALSATISQLPIHDYPAYRITIERWGSGVYMYQPEPVIMDSYQARQDLAHAMLSLNLGSEGKTMLAGSLNGLRLMPRAHCLIVVVAIDGVPQDINQLQRVLSDAPPGMRVIFGVLIQSGVAEHIQTIAPEVSKPHVVGQLNPLWLVDEIERLRVEMQNSCLLIG